VIKEIRSWLPPWLDEYRRFCLQKKGGPSAVAVLLVSNSFATKLSLKIPQYFKLLQYLVKYHRHFSLSVANGPFLWQYENTSHDWNHRRRADLRYVSEWTTFCVRGGTVTNSGGAGDFAAAVALVSCCCCCPAASTQRHSSPDNNWQLQTCCVCHLVFQLPWKHCKDVRTSVILSKMRQK